jgi:hypothetical protein
MTTATPKTARRATRRISDRRYYVQCSYRLALSAMALVAFVIANIHH